MKIVLILFIVSLTIRTLLKVRNGLYYLENLWYALKVAASLAIHV